MKHSSGTARTQLRTRARSSLVVMRVSLLCTKFSGHVGGTVVSARGTVHSVSLHGNRCGSSMHTPV